MNSYIKYLHTTVQVIVNSAVVPRNVVLGLVFGLGLPMTLLCLGLAYYVYQRYRLDAFDDTCLMLLMMPA
jgi:hypothetical protein